jgi:hypothetical protein
MLTPHGDPPHSYSCRRSRQKGCDDSQPPRDPKSWNTKEKWWLQVGIEPRRAHWVEIDQATFPRAPLRSCTVGFPEYSSDLGFPPEAFPTQGRLKRWLAYTPPRVGLPPGSSFKDGSSDPRR